MIKTIIVCMITIGTLCFNAAGQLTEHVTINEQHHQCTPTYFGNVLYVGGNGTGNYTTITEAINNATNGDTIFVYNGTYTENLNINKKVTILGEDPDTTIIQGISGLDAVVRIITSEVEINGFSLNGYSGGQDGVIVITLMQDIIIANNKITGCDTGIKIQPTAKYVTVSGNEITGNDFAGIFLQTSDRNEIAFNTIKNNGEWGIAIELTSQQNNITSNTIIDNYGGLKLSGSSGKNIIIDNNISKNDLEGILIEGLSSSNTIKENMISQNFGGIKISNSGQNIIDYNDIRYSSMEGILLTSSSNNIITQNNFINNKRHASYRLSSRNSWDANYWDNWIGFKFSMPIFQKFPKAIGGIILFTFDKNPALQPYQI